jgi:site-specific DNA recombinase
MPSARLTNCRSSQVEPSLVIWRYPLAWRGDLKVLTNPIYVGEWRFNRRQAKTGREKPAIEVIAVGVPPIIERQTFNEVQRTLKARNPRTTPPRVTTGPVLLTGLAHCACCGSAMTMRTGTSKTGKIYRYYSCSGAARMGKTACNGRSIQMDKLDQLVTSHIADRLLVPDRITDLLAEIIERRAMSRGEVRDRIDQLSREASAAEDKLRRLYALVEDGVTDLDDVLKTRLTDIKADRDRARSALDRIKERSSAASIDRVKIERFGALMRGNITTGDIPFRKAYLRWLIDAVEVDDGLIRIHGSKSTLEQAIVANSQADKGVRSFVRKWRSLGESNPCFSLERAAS